MAGDRRVQQREPTLRMVRWSGSPLSQQALALPYQDAQSRHRPMSDRGPTHNVDYPENSLHSGPPFAGGPHLRGAVRVHPQLRMPYSQQLQANMAHFDERTLRCLKLLQPSGFQASEPVQLALPFLLVPRSDWRVDTDQWRQPIGRNVRATLGRLACRAPPPFSGGLPRMIPASTSEISAPRRYEVAGFLFAGGNRLLSISIDASQAGGVIGQRLPIRSKWADGHELRHVSGEVLPVVVGIATVGKTVAGAIGLVGNFIIGFNTLGRLLFVTCSFFGQLEFVDQPDPALLVKSNRVGDQPLTGFSPSSGAGRCR